MGRAIQRCEPRDDMIVARFTCEILRPIPVGEIGVRARLARPGRSVQMLEAVASATAWRVKRTQSPPVAPRQPAPPLPTELPPEQPGEPPPTAPGWWVDGY